MMVFSEMVEMYVCPYCLASYSDKCDAQECAEECVLVSVREVEEKQVFMHKCEICETNYKKHVLASNCEKNHVKWKDMKFEEYEHKKRMMDLVQAGNARNQEKIERWLI